MAAKKKPAAKKGSAGKGVRKPATPNKERIIAVVLELMEQGQSLRKACEASAVPPSTFMRWVDADADLAEQYTRARERMLDVQAAELEEIGERAATAENAVEVAGLRLLSDNRKWLLSKLSPRKYGDKLALGGADDLPPIRSELTDTERAVRLAAFLKKGGDAQHG